MKIESSNRIRLPLEPDEHILSGWLRYNIRLGFAHLPFDRCLNYWGLPKQQLKPLRVNGHVLEKIIESILPDCSEYSDFMNKHSSRRMWLLGATELELKEEELEGVLQNNEKNMFSFHLGWQLCPVCLSEDKHRRGFSFWHRSHHLPSIAHCLKHNEPLLSHKELDHMKKLVMPDKHYQKLRLKPVENSDEIFEWSHFVGKVDQIVNEDKAAPKRWRSLIHSTLDLPIPKRSKHRSMYVQLLNEVEKDLGSVLMSHLFQAWRHQRKYRPNILWSILLSSNKENGIQNPVFWLVVIYWLRAHLPEFQER